MKKGLLIVGLFFLVGCSSNPQEVSVDGYNGEIVLQVKVNHDKIEEIEILQHQETQEVVEKPLQEMIDHILEAQSLNVEVISGATDTCHAVLQGIEKALLQAGFSYEQIYRPYTPIVQEATAKSKQYDVVVIGAGGAGLTAAISAAKQGAKVAVLEKMNEIGGNTVQATAMYNCVDDELQHPLGIYDSEEIFFQETYEGGHRQAKPELVRVLTSQADEGKQFLESLGLKFDTVIDNCLGGAHARGHYSLAHNGTDYIQVLKQACLDLNVDIYTNTAAHEIMKVNDTVVGVEAVNEGNKIIFEATSGVVLASGGFARNVEMRMQYNRLLTGEMLCSNARGNVGDGIIMAEKLGANLIGMEYIELYPMGDVYDGGLRNSIPNAINHGILVNYLGERFIREDANRDELSTALLNQNQGFAYSIVDDDYSNNENERIYLEGLVLMGQVYKADSIKELAKLLEVDELILKTTIEKYNQAVDEQYDLLGRETLYNKIDRAPYYATMKKPTIHHTLGGVEINEKTQVLDTQGHVIDGLYAAGEVTGGIHGANRLGGNSFPDMIVFGRIAGEQAASHS